MISHHSKISHGFPSFLRVLSITSGNLFVLGCLDFFYSFKLPSSPKSPPTSSSIQFNPASSTFSFHSTSYNLLLSLSPSFSLNPSNPILWSPPTVSFQFHLLQPIILPVTSPPTFSSRYHPLQPSPSIPFDLLNPAPPTFSFYPFLYFPSLHYPLWPFLSIPNCFDPLQISPLISSNPLLLSPLTLSFYSFNMCEAQFFLPPY